MDKFIPYEKLSKKQRRELNAQRREMWAISPVTRKPANPKAYNRRKTRKWINDDSHSVSSVFYKESPALLHQRPRKEVSIAKHGSPGNLMMIRPTESVVFIEG